MCWTIGFFEMNSVRSGNIIFVLNKRHLLISDFLEHRSFEQL